MAKLNSQSLREQDSSVPSLQHHLHQDYLAVKLHRVWDNNSLQQREVSSEEWVPQHKLLKPHQEEVYSVRIPNNQLQRQEDYSVPRRPPLNHNSQVEDFSEPSQQVLLACLAHQLLHLLQVEACSVLRLKSHQLWEVEDSSEPKLNQLSLQQAVYLALNRSHHLLD